MNDKNSSRPSKSRAHEQDLLAALLAEEGIASPASSVIRPRSVKGEPPLSFGQFRLWLLDQLQPGTALYNIPAALKMAGPLDVSALEKSLGYLVARHEVLRTTFSSKDGNPFQVIHPPFQVSASLVDVPGAPGAEREADLLRRRCIDPSTLKRVRC